MGAPNVAYAMAPKAAESSARNGLFGADSEDEEEEDDDESIRSAKFESAQVLIMKIFTCGGNTNFKFSAFTNIQLFYYKNYINRNKPHDS